MHIIAKFLRKPGRLIGLIIIGVFVLWILFPILSAKGYQVPFAEVLQIKNIINTFERGGKWLIGLSETAELLSNGFRNTGDTTSTEEFSKVTVTVTNGMSPSNMVTKKVTGRDTMATPIMSPILTPLKLSSPIQTPIPSPKLIFSPSSSPIVPLVTVTPIQSISTPTPTPTSISTPTPTLTPAPTLTITPTPTPTLSPSPTVQTSTVTIVINEIAWMGTATSSSDEWMELYNTTENLIDLSGWTLKSLTGANPDPIINLSGVIQPFGYFLLERTNDSTISDILADQIYTGALSDNGESLELRDMDGNLRDEVLNAGGWYAGNKTSRSSMERIDSMQFNDNATNWKTNDGITKNGHDAGNNPINGTPKTKNSGAI